MRAIVIQRYGGPEVLAIEERPDPQPRPGQVAIEVKAFGLNRAELYFRQGRWGKVAEVTGIECVGLVKHDSTGHLAPGQKVAALVGGMGRDLNGSYAECTCVPASNVAPIQSDLPWEVLAAIPESYATAWTALITVLELTVQQTILIRGGTSALGQAAINIAVQAGAQVLATTRSHHRMPLLTALGTSEVLREHAQLAADVRKAHPQGIDAVLDLVGNTTVLDSLATLRRNGRICLAGFLGGTGPLTMEPVFQMPSGRQLSVFASALALGTADFPLSGIPFDTFFERVSAGAYKARPTQVFRLDDIQQAHRLMESNQAIGKLVVRV